MVITNTATDGGALTIDSFQVFGANTAATITTGNSNSNSSSGPNGGIIAAAVIGCLLVVLLILGLIFFLWKRKRNNDEREETDKFSIAQTSYIERVRNINFTFPAFPGRKRNAANNINPTGLSRSVSRGSEDTIVDPESGNMAHTQKKGVFGYGFGLGGGPKKWLDNVKGMVVRNPDPTTPPLPVQNQQRERPVLDIRNANGGNNVSPGMVTVGLESGVPGGNMGYAGGRNQHNNPDAAQVWVAGNQRIEASRRFSDQSLEQAWDNRGQATGAYDVYGHRRNQSTPAVSRILSQSLRY